MQIIALRIIILTNISQDYNLTIPTVGGHKRKTTVQAAFSQYLKDYNLGFFYIWKK